MKETQAKKIYNFLLSRDSRGAQTWEVNKFAVNNFICSGDSILRKLRAKGLVYNMKLEDNKCKTWFVTTTIYSQGEFNETGN